MKINSTSSKPVLPGVASGARTETASHNTAGNTQRDSSAVDLSPAAKQLAALHNDSADIQAGRVQQIRDALASGELQIDPGRIADRLLAHVQDLLK